MGYNLLMNRVYWGYNPLIPTFDPNNGSSKIRRFGSLFLNALSTTQQISGGEKTKSLPNSDFHKGKIHVSTPKAI